MKGSEAEAEGMASLWVPEITWVQAPRNSESEQVGQVGLYLTTGDRIPSPSICAIQPKDTETEVVISVLWVYLRRCAPTAGIKACRQPKFLPTTIHQHRSTPITIKHVKQCQY